MISEGRNNRLLDNWKCLIICCVVSMANCQYGFDTAAVAGFQAMIGFLEVFGYREENSKSGWNINTKPQQLISSFLNVGTIVAVLLGGPFSHKFGRKPAIWVAAVVSMVACGVQVGVNSLAGLYAGRILLGLGNGFFILFSNTYTVEVAPPQHRAILASFFGFWVNLGSILGAIADNYSKTLDSKLAYRIPLASLFAIPVLLSVFVFFVPESPRWLLLHNRPEEARQALEKLRGTSLKPELLNEEFVEMQRGIEQEKEMASSTSVFDMFKGTDRRRTILAAGAIASHAASGIWFTISYSTFFYQMAGIEKPFQATIMQNCLGLVGALCGMFLMHKVFGRRPMLLIGSAGCGICMLVIGLLSLAGHSHRAGQALVAFALLFNFFYNGFTGTITWPIAGELVSSRLRVFSVGLGTGINYFFNWLISYCTPYFLNANNLNWGAKYGYIWAGSNAIAFLFFFLLIPETKGRSLEEIDEMFVNKVPRRQFKTYQCVSSERAREIAEQQLDDLTKGGATVHTEKVSV
ncbi:putative sugar transporter [Cladophialophora carrionii]|uniref:Putative sugar transporter n=1 Tax=Cladophialophora carrionii TaxID=86049 RepID=A0A1C1CC67_9EURO|nr:putative sugar transporter [Cladophialophora carrionii]